MTGKMNDDAHLLWKYSREGSEQAFRDLVERHLPLVNATARRMTNGNTHLAQDVTQLVFTDLARKAGSLPEGTVLGGWLHRHTCYTALKAIRTETRRRTRERTAMELNDINQDAAQDAHWLQLAPVLDEALNCLGDEDRNAIVLRYFQQQDVRTVGEALGTSESAAQKRLGRALEKLRALISRRGVAVASAVTLASTLEASPVAVAVPGLATTIATHALGAATTAAVTTTLTLASLKTMITSKLVVSLTAVAAFGAVTTRLVTKNGTDAAPAVASAPVPVAKPPAAPLVVKATSSQVAAPVVPPAAARDADPATQPAPEATTPTENVFAAAPEPLVWSNNSGTVSGGTMNLNDPFGQTTVVTSGTGFLTLSGANPDSSGGTSSDSAVFGSGTNVIMLTGQSGTGGGPVQFSDNGDGTMSATFPDGTTQTIPKPSAPVILTNGGKAATLIMSTGTTQTVPGSGGTGGAVITGSGAVIIKSSPQP